MELVWYQPSPTLPWTAYVGLTRNQPGLHEAFKVICRPGMHSPCFFFGASLQCMAQMLTRHTFSSAIRCMIKMGSKQSFAHSAKIILPVFRTLPINNLRRKWHGCRMSRMSVSKASVLPAVVQWKKKWIRFLAWPKFRIPYQFLNQTKCWQ